jgi:hypothetical protein
MNKKKPNKVVQIIDSDSDDEEPNPYEFQDSVLSCLSDLQHLATTMKEKAEAMEDEIKRFKVSIHGEDIDE